MRIRIPYILLIISILLTTCEKEEEGSFMVFTGQVNVLQYDNIEFNGRLQLSDNIKIIDHGFIFPSFEKISLGETDNSGNFKFNYGQILNPDYVRSVSAYVETEDGLFFGERVSFSPLRLKFIKIYPGLLYLNDILTLEGERLLPENNELSFYLNDLLCEIILKTNEKIQIKVPETIDKSQLKLKVAIGDQEFEHGVVLNIKTPVINSIEKRSGASGDTIIVHGDYLGNRDVTTIKIIDGWGHIYELVHFLSIDKNSIKFFIEIGIPYNYRYIEVEVMGKIVYEDLRSLNILNNK